MVIIEERSPEEVERMRKRAEARASNLTNLRDRPDRREIAIKGGSTVTEKKLLMQKIKGAKWRMCKNCKADCYLKPSLIAKNPRHTCLFPVRYVEAMKTGCPITEFDETILKGYLNEILTFYKDEYNRALEAYYQSIDDKLEEKKIKQLKTEVSSWASRIAYLSGNVKKDWYPATQKSIQVNVSTSVDVAMEKIKQYKLKQLEEQGIKIIEEPKKKEEEIENE